MGNPLALLTDLRVLEFSDSVASATAALHLALLGAQVVVAEPPGGSPLRRLATQGWDASFRYASRGKTSCSLDEALVDLSSAGSTPDVLFEPQQPEPLLRAALEEFRQRTEAGRTIIVSFAECDGRVLTELEAQAASGMPSFLGSSDSPALRVGYEVVTYSAAVLAVQGIIAALLTRDRCDRGQLVRVPLSRAAASLLNNVSTASIAPEQDSVFSRGWSKRPYTGVPCADGAVEFLFYGRESADGWRRFCEEIGAQALLSDLRFSTYEQRLDRSDELIDALATFTSVLKRDACLDLLRRTGAMAMPMNSVAQAALCEQASANIMIDNSGGETQGLPGGPWELDGVRPFVGRMSDSSFLVRG